MLRHSIRLGTRLVLALTLVLGITLPDSVSGQFKRDSVKHRGSQPNIILLNLDDADFELLSGSSIVSRYPNLGRFVFQGIEFTNFHVTTSLCGPSRACLLRGQYAHKTNIRVNDPNHQTSNGLNGGMTHYHDQGFMSNDLSTWMKDAGYRTMLVGKYLHAAELPMVPEGWDDFYHYMGGDYFGAYRFTNETDPEGEGEAMPLTTYRTELETADTINILTEHFNRDDGSPFFLYLNPLAPHNEAVATREFGMIADHYKHWWPNLSMPQDASVDEKNISDKTTAINSLERLDSQWMETMQRRYRDRVLAMKSVDDMFGSIYHTLTSRGQADNTYIFLTSDNGMLLGHYRLFGKSNCYERANRVPAWVIGPGIQGGQSANHLLAQIDFAPTILELAGADVPELIDGKSFRDLLFAPDAHPEHLWRDALLLENWRARFYRGDTYQMASNSVRFYDSIYSEWADGTAEYFDLVSDPLQLRNKISTLETTEQSLYSNYLRLLKESADEPIVTVSSPWIWGDLISRNEVVAGLAVDDDSINRVELSIRRLSDFHFWNGSDWQEDRIRVTATLKRPGQQMTTWEYSNLPRMSSSDELVGVWPRVYDNKGNFNPEVPSAIFRIDFTRPESTITYPAFGSDIVGSQLVVQGTASDDRQVEFIRLVVQNQTTGLYYNGKSWQTNWGFVLLPIEEDNTWSYTLPNTSGFIYLGSRAVDDSGNVQRKPGSTWFRLN